MATGQTDNGIQRLANKIARAHGYGRATHIVVGTENTVLSHIRYGYRKYTTGQYVSNSYRNNFGWKNTYYQCAITEVSIDKNDAFLMLL